MANKLATGIIPAPVLPFEEDGSIDWRTLADYIAQVGAGAPNAIGMNMALSEVSSLDVQEQLEVIRRCKETLAGSCPLLSGVSATHTAQAVDLAQRLVDAGAEGLVIFPTLPAFLGPVSIAMVDDYYGAISEKVSVPLIGFRSSAVQFPAGWVKSVSRLNNFVSFKDSSYSVENTLNSVSEARATGRHIGVLTGSDTFIFEALLMGCDGAMIGFAATATAQLVKMYDYVSQGRITEAFEIWKVLAPLARVCWRSPGRDNRVRMKYVLAQQGIFKNYKVRKPFLPLAENDRTDIDACLAQGDLTGAAFHPAGAKWAGTAAKRAGGNA